MPSWMAWVQRPSGLIKMQGSTSALREATLIKVENVSQKQILIIDLKHICYNKYQLVKYNKKRVDMTRSGF